MPYRAAEGNIHVCPIHANLSLQEYRVNRLYTEIISYQLKAFFFFLTTTSFMMRVNVHICVEISVWSSFQTVYRQVNTEEQEI